MPMQFSPQQAAELAEMMVTLGRNPKTRPQVAKLVREAGINLPPDTFADVDAVNAAEATKNLDQRIEDKITGTFEARDRKTAADATMSALNRQRQDLIDDGGYTEEFVKDKLEPWMQERGITSYEDAAILYAAKHPDPTPHPHQSTKGIWEMPAGDILKDPRTFARKAAYEAVADLMRQRR
jgi:hypothetical protein